jgi:hypothetical protein
MNIATLLIGSWVILISDLDYGSLKTELLTERHLRTHNVLCGVSSCYWIKNVFISEYTNKFKSQCLLGKWEQFGC